MATDSEDHQMNVQNSQRDAFVAPSPGEWRRLGDHFPGALTPEYQRLYTATCPPGLADYMARYGVLARGIDVAYIHGHAYLAPVPLAGPREMKRVPPRAAIWTMARLHPAFRARTRAARSTLADRPWRRAAAQWFSAERAQWIDRNRTVESVTPSSLADQELSEHLLDCARLATDGYRRHFELHGDDLLPVGLLVARCAEWGIDAATAGTSLVGAADRTMEPIAAEWQLVSGYDLDSLARCELTRPTTHPSATPAAGDLRRLVASEHHDELQQLVDDARAAAHLRDDNGEVIGAWPLGLLRRSMLEAGRRLGLARPELAVEALVSELVQWLETHDGHVDELLEERFIDRQRRSRLAAPDKLGPEFPIPPLDALPRPLALIAAAQLAAMDQMLGSQAVGIGSAPHTGRALIVDDPGHALDLIEPGDVIVTNFTCPSWNTVIALAGGLVTATGGPLSHAATLARELGIPAVVGLPAATTRFAHASQLCVDPVNATVTPVDRSVS